MTVDCTLVRSHCYVPHIDTFILQRIESYKHFKDRFKKVNSYAASQKYSADRFHYKSRGVICTQTASHTWQINHRFHAYI